MSLPLLAFSIAGFETYVASPATVVSKPATCVSKLATTFSCRSELFSFLCVVLFHKAVTTY